MESAKSSQFREFIGKLLVKGSDENIAKIDKTKIQNALIALTSADSVAFNNVIAFINNDMRLNVITDQHFIVGDVFRHRGGEGYTPMYIWEGAQNLLFTPNKERVIAINKTIGKLRDYPLTENMNDSKIQKKAKSTPMSEDEYFLAMFLLIVKPELGKEVLGYTLDTSKYYLFHVKLSSGKVVALGLGWYGAVWGVVDFAFDTNGNWNQGNMLLYFATAK